MSYYRHYDLDTRIALKIGEWMYQARNGSTDAGGQPPVEPPQGSHARELPYNLAEPSKFSLIEGIVVSVVTGFALVAACALLFIDT